jgi:two-component system copper resistance phosphate regulon response regulator CusR
MLGRVKMLVIEDDGKIAQAIRRGLEAEGYDVAVARTGDEGMLRLKSEAFDLVVLDWMLPGRDGIEILKSLRACGVNPPPKKYDRRGCGGCNQNRKPNRLCIE